MTFTRCCVLVLFAAGCAPQEITQNENVSSTDSALSGCSGTASSTIPASGNYYLTTFGGAGNSGTMSCGESTKSGSWYYMASRQRFGCGAHVRLTANGNCVVAEADDYGPDACVEKAAGMPVIDASPLVAQALFSTSSAGWSDRLEISAEIVDSSTPLGACTDSSSGDGSTIAPISATGSTTGSTATCSSSTLGTTVTAGQCVQSDADNDWYQCTSDGWAALDDSGNGPLGACTASYPD